MGDPCKLHVGNLSYNASEDDLRCCFEKFGKVEKVIVVTDRDTGRNRGFAFVIFEDADDAKDAREALDNTDIAGRCVRVNESRPRNDDGGRGYGGGRGSRRGGYGGDRYSGGGGGYDKGYRYGDDGQGGSGDRSGGSRSGGGGKYSDQY